MPPSTPIVKKGVFNRREKITIDGLTATRGHHQHLKRQRMKQKLSGKAKAGDLTAETAAAHNTNTSVENPQQTQHSHGQDGAAHHATPDMYYDYKRGCMVKLEENEALVAWAASAERVSGGRIKSKKEEVGKKRKRSDTENKRRFKEEDLEKEAKRPKTEDQTRDMKNVKLPTRKRGDA